ncbi:MAG TPA: GntR family transcriptional regulator [Vicinamibacterales bacterium]|nr:GntR family transcriptional regulator [Vicinamibacterales bacterium]
MRLPFSVDIRPGRPLHDQVVFAVTKAVVTGQLAAGDAFPSVRALSQELRINPNTAQKIVGTLIERGLLEPRPGIGTVVAAWQPAANPARRASLASQIDRLAVEARQLGMTLSDLLDAIRRAWK